MVQFTEAVFENGVLRPTQPLQLAEHQRVRLAIVEEGTTASSSDVRPPLFDGSEALILATGGQMPTREQMYDRD